jgi:hypothetical protein
MTVDEVPEAEADWHALEVAMRDALADCRIILHRPAYL